jgi:DNA-binding MarR family transcriptional regulator
VSGGIATRGTAPGGAPTVPLEPPWRTLREAYFLFRRQWTEQLGRFDLTFSDYVVLDLLSRSPAKASEVAEAIGITAAGATDLLDRLAARGLLRRVADPTDRRVVRIRLTPTGRRLYDEAAAGKDTSIRYLNRAMTAAERRALSVGLAALTRALREEREAPEEGG